MTFKNKILLFALILVGIASAGIIICGAIKGLS